MAEDADEEAVAMTEAVDVAVVTDVVKEISPRLRVGIVGKKATRSANVQSARI